MRNIQNSHTINQAVNASCERKSESFEQIWLFECGFGISPENPSNFQPPEVDLLKTSFGCQGFAFSTLLVVLQPPLLSVHMTFSYFFGICSGLGFGKLCKLFKKILGTKASKFENSAPNLLESCLVEISIMGEGGWWWWWWGRCRKAKSDTANRKVS